MLEDPPQQVRMMERVGKRMMMAPSTGCGGGGRLGTAAFVTGNNCSNRLSNTLLRWRRSSTASIATATTTLLSSSSSTLADDSFYPNKDDQTLATNQQQPTRIPRADEPNLYDIPSNLHPTYQPIPILLQITIAIASALIVGRKSVARLFNSSSFFANLLSALTTPLHQQSDIRLLSPTVLRKTLFFVLRTVLLTTIARLAIQERFFPPSRVTTQYLSERNELPSSLSRYEMVNPLRLGLKSVPTTTTTTSWTDDKDADNHVIGVHSIQYAQDPIPTIENTDQTNKYDGISFHHGFGASSLSWLPVLPSLVHKIGNPKKKVVGIAHDAPGFGFTDRPNGDTLEGLWQYSSENNVGIGLALLKQALFSSSSDEKCTDNATRDEYTKKEDGEVSSESNQSKSIAIFGHSMGSKAALQMALYCASHPKLQIKPDLVVLVAPALEGGTLPSRSGASSPKAFTTTKPSSSDQPQKRGLLQRILSKLFITWRKLFLDYPFQYGLRRLVSASPNFWRKGLSLAWGDPTTRLSDSDVLRFAWPSIGLGWEEGLINFTRSKLGSSSLVSSNPSRYAVLDDVQLLQEVANLKDTKVVIVYGSKDNVVRIEGSVSERLKKEYPGIKLVRMEGMGHDPFEEDVDGFLKALEKALK